MKGGGGEQSVSVCGPACVNSVKPTRSASATVHRHARAPQSSQKHSRSTDFDFNAVADRVEQCVGRQEEHSSIVKAEEREDGKDATLIHEAAAR